MLLGVVVAMLLIWTTWQDRLTLQKLQIAQSISSECINLTTLGRDIARHPEERRAPRQWQATYQRLDELLRRVDGSDYQDRIERMRHEQQALDSLFRLLTQSDTSTDPAFFQARLQRLENQMALHAQSLATEAGNLMRFIRQQKVEERQWIDLLIVALLLLLTLFLTLFIGLNGRSLLQRLQRMQAATGEVGAGNLDYRINDAQCDELGDFSRAFDAMAGNLKQVTASLDDLQRETEAREQAQAELQQYKNHLEELVITRTLELEQSNRQLRETQFAMDRSGIGIQWLDGGNGHLQYVNDQTGTMLGYTREALLQLCIFDICPDFPVGYFGKLAGSCCEKGFTRFEAEYRDKVGRLFPVEVVLYYQPAQTEVGSRYIVFISDISQRKIAEQALLQAKDAAEAANRAKSVFLANMSHELRTPLNAILGFAQIMERDETLGDAQRSQLETINRSGRHLLSLINDVLEISRIEAGRTTVQSEVFCLADMVSEVEDMIRVRVQSKGLRFVSKRRGELPRYVVGDAHHLRQVLINLLGNAVKYTDQGSVTLSLQAVEDSISFEVADTGIGIAAEDQPRIFQAFYQTDAGVAKGEGTGLGLAISREFVRLMGGEIVVDSEPGKGSVFTFSLALPEADAPAFAIPPSRVIGLAADQLPVRVLVVEDNPDNRALLALLLSSVGFEVRTAENGRLAIACFESWQPQFIWMDMRMPVLDGYEATKIIRELPGGKQVKIAALTASAFHEDRNAIIAAGCDEMLAKPVDEYRLFRVMENQLGLRYRFAEEGTPAAKAQLPSPAALDLSPLSPELRAELAEAADRLDAEAVQAIIGRLGPEFSEQAGAIATWVDAYRFDVVAKLCRDA